MKRGLALLLVLSGCIPGQKMAKSQASYDHQCPEERIDVVREAGDKRSFELDVCGKRRNYRNMTPPQSEGVNVWVDVTKLQEN